jgi:hypothetical protein
MTFTSPIGAPAASPLKIVFAARNCSSIAYENVDRTLRVPEAPE